MESNAPNNLTASIKLNAPHDWPDWISTLRQHARSSCIWERIDPAQPDHSDDAFKAPELPKNGDELERLIRTRFDIDDEDKISVTSRALFCEILI